MPRCLNPRCQMDYPQGIMQCTNQYCRCILPDAVVAGRYTIEMLIGIGGMGSVYRAYDSFEMQHIALKVLTTLNNIMDHATASERFRREARYAREIQHNNIVPVLNFGQDGSLLYLVMPLITGGTLKDLLKGEHPLPIAQARRYLRELAEAINAMHNHPRQIIHRDIKPSNLLIHQDDGRLVVTDFGIARAMQQEKSITQRGWSLGTEHYIAPEQELGQAKPASDIYAMGVVAYQIFTGLLPMQAVIQHRSAQLPGPSLLNVSLPSALDPIVLRALEIEPEKRFSTASEFANAIDDALADIDVSQAPTITVTAVATHNANIVVRTFVPENPCSYCGQENRSRSHFCRQCGNSLNDTSPLITEVCQVGYVSDPGRRSQDNEDVLLVAQGLCSSLLPPRPFSLFAVSDGLRSPKGRIAGGHEASIKAIDALMDTLLPRLTSSAYRGKVSAFKKETQLPTSFTLTPQVQLEHWLLDAVQRANQVVYHYNTDYETSIACTLTTALLYKHHLLVTNIGDSRAYHYNSQKGLRLLTTDHTLAARMVESGLLGSGDLLTTSKRHRHYRKVGEQYHTSIDLFHCEVEVDDLILLCTDGLWHMLRNDRIQAILKLGGDPQKLAHLLTEAANTVGGEGNISVIVIRVQ